MDGRLGFNGMLPVYHARESLKFISKADGIYRDYSFTVKDAHTKRFRVSCPI